MKILCFVGWDVKYCDAGLSIRWCENKGKIYISLLSIQMIREERTMSNNAKGGKDQKSKKYVFLVETFIDCVFNYLVVYR